MIVKRIKILSYLSKIIHVIYIQITNFEANCKESFTKFLFDKKLHTLLHAYLIYLLYYFVKKINICMVLDSRDIKEATNKLNSYAIDYDLLNALHLNYVQLMTFI